MFPNFFNFHLIVCITFLFAYGNIYSFFTISIIVCTSFFFPLSALFNVGLLFGGLRFSSDLFLLLLYKLQFILALLSLNSLLLIYSLAHRTLSWSPCSLTYFFDGILHRFTWLRESCWRKKQNFRNRSESVQRFDD